MHFLSLLALTSTVAAQGVSKGFNYGNVFTSGSPKQQSDFEAEFNRAKSLPNTSGFTSARLYTMIQGGTTNTPISALQAAIDTDTSLLLGLWASASSDVFQNELDALSSAIDQYGSALTDLIVGISVGSEDLYRVSVQGIENDSGLGEGPDVLVDYIQRTRSVIAGTAASEAPVGHVDTWNDWVNGSNSAVIDEVDWIGFNAFPYWESSQDNAVENAFSLFHNALSAVEGVAQDKPVWITETGWAVSGDTQGAAVASVDNTKTYWDDVGCDIFDNYNVWWYILRDNNGSPAPDPSFGIVGIDLGEPLFDLSCPAQSNGVSTSESASSSATPSAANGTVLSNVTAELNDTSDGVVASSVANVTQAANTTAAVFDLDIPQIMQHLPSIVAANPHIVKDLPKILSEHPGLLEKVRGLNLTEVAHKIDVPPVYVDMLKNAVGDHEKEINKAASAAGIDDGADEINDLLHETKEDCDDDNEE